MQGQTAAAAAPVAQSPTWGPLEAGIATFAVLHVGLALLMAIDAHEFFTAVGPFGAYNAHYIHDVATFYAAIGAGLAVSLWRTSWRVPMLAITLVQYALHSVNHLIDIGNAHPAWTGYFDFFSLAAATLLLAWLLKAALAARPDHGSPTTRTEGAIR